MSAKPNNEEKINNGEVLTEEEAASIEAVFFEDDAEIKLRDGKIYKIPPANLKNARRLMGLLKSVNIDAIMLNFLPSEFEDEDGQKEKDLIEVLSIAFINYPKIDEEFILEYVDLETASKIIEIVIGLNRLKKSKPQSVKQE